MPQKLFARYDGPLSPQECAQGCLLSVENARSLQKEAALLLENGHSARTHLLAMIGAEEVVKAYLFGYAALIPPKDQQQWRNFWIVLRNHDAKELFNYVLKLWRKEFSELSDFVKAVNLTGAYLEVRNLSTYVDRTDLGWLIPEDVLPAAIAKRGLEDLGRRLTWFDKMKDEADVLRQIESLDPDSFRKSRLFTKAVVFLNGWRRSRTEEDEEKAGEALGELLASMPRQARAPAREKGHRDS